MKSFIKNKNYTNNSTISSAINSINNKSDCNTNKCNDSTNITSNNLECNKETNNNKNDPKKISSNNLESEFNDNKSINKINRKLIYNDFSEIEKKPQKNSIVKIQIQKNNEKINSSNAISSINLTMFNGIKYGVILHRKYNQYIMLNFGMDYRTYTKKEKALIHRYIMLYDIYNNYKDKEKEKDKEEFY